ncbi:hypothetical protein [Paraburkholderia sp. RL17-347-BIC-D]|uniref:hypothetical protein n=1 Tax=Paraburkholderia sp. RL17-347-BIC-D TaxID=3031632 RepID=UPI0038B9F3B2
MSRADQYQYEIERQRRRDLAFQRMRDTTRPFLQRYRALLDDVRQQGLDAFAQDEYRELSERLRAMESQLDSDPPAVRDQSRALGERFHALPRLARQMRRLHDDARREADEAYGRAQAAEQQRRRQVRDDIESAWRDGVAAWSSPVAARSAFGDLQALRERMLNDAPMDAAQLKTAIGEIKTKHEAQARRQQEDMAERARGEAMQDVLSLQRAQIEADAPQADARAARLREALAAATGLDAHTQLERLDAIAREQDEAALDESQRREVARAVYQSLTAAGFVTDQPVRQTGSQGEDEVLIRARRPAGPQAEFRIDLAGALTSKFHQYRGSACNEDIAPVMARLQDAYGITLSDRRVIWVNPDDADQDALPRPDMAQGRSS